MKILTALLRQGVTPEKLALSVALGITLGIFPMLGTTTLLCAAAGLYLGLNQPALQGVNYIAYPLQLALLIPFFRGGEWLFNAPRLGLTRQAVQLLWQSGLLHAIHTLWGTTWHAMVVWGLAAPVISAGIYYSVLPLLRRLVIVK